jgi:hypothetical protein
MTCAFANAPVAAGYPMVDSFTIRNFRSFDDVKVDNCRRINILVGENGSGKTALLEALFLAAGVSPELAVRTRYWRSGENLQLSGNQEDLHEALWSDLFYKFQINHAAVISLRGKGEHNRSVTVSINPQGSMKVIPPSRGNSREPPRVVRNEIPIEFKWDVRGYGVQVVHPYFNGQSLVVPPVASKYVKASYFAANQTTPNSETANNFSRLSKKLHEAQFIARYRKIYPNIKTLSIEISAGMPTLYAEVENMEQKIPLSLASGGMYKLASILVAMARHVGGLIIIDEIENGFYFTKIPEMWKVILEFARKYDCQVFASTHSAECLTAAAELADQNADEFSVLQAAMDDGATKISQIAGDSFVSAVRQHFELR